MPTSRQNEFVDFCLLHYAKPLMIELAQGEHIHQPMLTKLIYTTTLEDALQTSTQYADLLNQTGFVVNRLKIETMPEYTKYFANDGIGKFADYYEWHGKIYYERPVELLAFCEKNKVHLSINALKNTPGLRFITLREFGDEATFNTRIGRLVEGLAMEGWQLVKQQAEYCIYDNNRLLDNGWLPQ